MTQQIHHKADNADDDHRTHLVLSLLLAVVVLGADIAVAMTMEGTTSVFLILGFTAVGLGVFKLIKPRSAART